MSYGGARAFAAAFRAIGFDSVLSPDGDERTKELAAKYTSGDECYPERVTLGNFLKVTEQKDFDPSRTAFFMPTATGPCRFGQYAPFLRMTMAKLGFDDVLILAPTSANSYREIGENALYFRRVAWWGLIAADMLRRMLHKTRPYELEPGATDAAYEACLDELCAAIEDRTVDRKKKLQSIASCLIRCRDRFRAIDTEYSRPRLLIGVVGEIFCRLNTFSNEHLIRKIEACGGEAWLSDIGEWVWYTNAEQKKNLRMAGKTLSRDMLGAWLTGFVQRRDEHKLLESLEEEFVGYEEPHNVLEVLELSKPYLPYTGALGEMVLSVGKAIYLQKKGADGIVDISPFTCMNGIVCEAVYPRVSRDYGNIPIKTFYFDGTAVNLDNDVEIFMELAANYSRSKRVARRYPSYFSQAAGRAS
jgi:predicted nucleotide-binding protein (sugar kinase/HSP70/actin superfamily)